MKLFYTPGACSLAAHIAAVEAGLEIELTPVDLRANPRMAGDRLFSEINPKNSVPALQLDDGEVLTECAAILQYLAAKVPSAKLAPEGHGMEHWRFVELLNYLATEVHKSFGPLFNPTTPAEMREAAIARLGQRFDVLDARLASQPFLTGDAFTIADAYAFTLLGWTRMIKLGLEPWPNLQAFTGRVAARPAVQKAMKAEGLI